MPRDNKKRGRETPKSTQSSSPPSKLPSGEVTPNSKRRYVHKEVTRELINAINILRRKESTDSKS